MSSGSRVPRSRATPWSSLLSPWSASTCLGLGDGATTASPLATFGDTTWIVYVESTARDPAQGSPVFVVPFDRRTGVLGERVLLAWSQPANDGHAQPGIALDSRGYLPWSPARTGGRSSTAAPSFRSRRTEAGRSWRTCAPPGTACGRRAPQEGRQTYLAFVVRRA